MRARTHGRCDMHQTRVIADRVRGETQQVNNVFQRGLAAQINRRARRRDRLSGNIVFIGSKHPDRETIGHKKPRKFCKFLQRPALRWPIFGARHQCNNRLVGIQFQCLQHGALVALGDL